MLLAVGIWLGVLGYTTMVWGQKVTVGDTQSFAYLIGLSDNPGGTSVLAQPTSANGYPNLMPPARSQPKAPSSGGSTHGNTGSQTKPFG